MNWINVWCSFRKQPNPVIREFLLWLDSEQSPTGPLIENFIVENCIIGLVLYFKMSTGITDFEGGIHSYCQ